MPSYLDTDQKTRKSGWRYQRSVPKDLRPLLGKKRFVKHIRAMPRREAEKIAAGYALADERLIRALRGATDEERALIVAHGGLDRLRSVLPTMEKAHGNMQRFVDHMDAIDVAAVAAGVNANQAKLGMAGPSATPGDIAQSFLRAKAYKKFLEPELNAARQVVRKTAERPAGTTLVDLLALWARVRTPKSTRKQRASVKLLEEFLGGDVDVGTITQDHIAAFRDHMETQKKISTGQQGSHIKKLRAIFKVAVDERRLPLNPAAGIIVHSGKRPKNVIDGGKAFYSGEQVRTILERAEATKFGGKTKHADVLWALKLAFYTGARINEVCQLRKEDVTIMDGIPVLTFHEGAEGQSIKNPSSARRVPLHPAVIAFLEYADGAKGPWVFGSLKHHKEHGRAGWLSQNFKKFRRDVCGITSDVKLHGARHHFIDAMRDAGVPEDRRQAIVGHAGNGMHAKYGRGTGLKVLAAEMAKIDPLA